MEPKWNKKNVCEVGSERKVQENQKVAFATCNWRQEKKYICKQRLYPGRDIKSIPAGKSKQDVQLWMKKRDKLVGTAKDNAKQNATNLNLVTIRVKVANLINYTLIICPKCLFVRMIKVN